MNKIKKTRTNQTISGFLLALAASTGYTGTMGPVVNSSGTIYLGIFGGGGSLSGDDTSLTGTAFFPEATGGPLAVDAFGKSKSSSTGMVGGHIGFAWANTIGIHVPVTPAVELEGYYMGGAKVQGEDINNNTTRLAEHDFLVSYPLKTGVFLINAVLNSNNSGSFKPYIGLGIGSAILSISGANATQISPSEPNLNHFNSDPNDKAIAFAAQPKIGISYNLNSNASIFAEYRFLYLSETNYTFGSTVVDTHVATAPWLVKMKPQYYNMGTVGVNFDL